MKRGKNPNMARKLSKEHYVKLQAARQAARPSEQDRFDAKVDRSGGPDACHLWTASCGKDGYGRFMFRGAVLNAHRVAKILELGSVPAGMDVDHFRCKERRCVNLTHLRVVTETVSALENNESPHAKNARKTHCIRGHKFAGVNKNGHRVCNLCRRKGARVPVNQSPIHRTEEM